MDWTRELIAQLHIEQNDDLHALQRFGSIALVAHGAFIDISSLHQFVFSDISSLHQLPCDDDFQSILMNNSSAWLACH